MRQNIHIGWLVFWGLIILGIGWQLNNWFKIPFKTVSLRKTGNFDIVTLKLPNSVDTNVFGSKYWEARHFLAELIPCSLCRIDAVSHEKFFHDYVNSKTGKNKKYPDNYNDWIKKICNREEKKNNG